jgi:small subunit ribosomal protein S17
MADTPETPDTETPDPAPDEAMGSAAEAGTGEEAGAPAGPAPTKAEQRAASRHAEASKRPARTPEERQAERDATRKAKAVARRRRRLQEREKARANRTEVPEPTAPREAPTGRPKVRQGIVVSDKADKTITVRIDTARRHRRYEKIVRSSSTLHAHDENNDANAGDTVRVVESRPLSRTKRWRLEEVLERAK